MTQWHHTSYNSNEFPSHVQRPALTVNFKPTKFCFCRNMICCKTRSRFFSIMMDLCKCAVLPPLHLQCFYNIHFSDFWKAEFVVHFMVFCETNSIFQHLPPGSEQATRHSSYFTLILQMIWSELIILNSLATKINKNLLLDFSWKLLDFPVQYTDI